jgi:hypothetical protein
VGGAVVLAEPPEVLELPLQGELLEQGAAEVEADPVMVEHVDLLAQAVGDDRGAPAELDVVDVLGAELDLVGELAERDAAVDHHREAGFARLRRPPGQQQRGRSHLIPPGDFRCDCMT